jgi:4-hydroxy-tetrahydrodipicolinate synthase
MTSNIGTITGSIVALATPMNLDGSVDYPALRKLIDWHITEGTDCIGVVGTTGESPTVSVQEHCEIIRVSVEESKRYAAANPSVRCGKHVPIMAGCGANSTAEAIELAKYAKQVGADSQLQVVPYYNRPTQEGQYLHFKAIAEAVALPMVLYNVPGRTVADMSVETTLRLARVDGIVGIKEASGNIDKAQWLIKGAQALKADTGGEVGKDFAIYSGDDPTAVAMMLCGGQGNISVTANIAPKLLHELCVAAVAGNIQAAMAIQFKLLSLHKAMGIEGNPIAVKWAMKRLGLCGPALRLPLTELTAANQPVVEAAMREAGLIA